MTDGRSERMANIAATLPISLAEIIHNPVKGGLLSGAAGARTSLEDWGTGAIATASRVLAKSD